MEEALRLRHASRSVLKWARYVSVSVIATGTSLVVLGVMVGVFHVSSVWSNVVATAVGTVPSFELNRRWVWSRRGKIGIIRQVVPFCALSLVGLALSSIAVHIASDWTSGSSRLIHTAAVETAHIGTFGLLWIVQYILCNMLFAQRANHAPVPQAAFTHPHSSVA